jgi:hypothetical protein
MGHDPIARRGGIDLPLSPYAALAGAMRAPAATTPATRASAVRRLTASLSSPLEALTAKAVRAAGATRGAATVTEAPVRPLLAEASEAPLTTSPEDTAAAHAMAAAGQNSYST